jgi:hypothetical protein
MASVHCVPLAIVPLVFFILFYFIYFLSRSGELDARDGIWFRQRWILRIRIASRARPNEDDVVDSWNCHHHHHHQSSSLPVLSRSTKLPTDDVFPACISPPPLPSLLRNHLSFSFLPFVLLRNFAVVRTQTCMYLFTSCVSGLHFQRDESGGLARSNLNLVFFFLFFRLSREWVKGERGEGERRGILNLPFL